MFQVRVCGKCFSQPLPGTITLSRFSLFLRPYLEMAPLKAVVESSCVEIKTVFTFSISDTRDW